MAFVSTSSTIKLHDFPTGQLVHTFDSFKSVPGPIRGVSWSKDGNWLAFVPHEGPTEILTLKDGPKLIHTIQAIKNPTCVSFQKSKRKHIAIGTKSGEVLIYDLKAKKISKSLPKASSAVTRIEFTAKDGHVVAACEDGTANIYSTVQNNLSGSFKVPRCQSMSTLRANPNKRNYIAAGSNEGVVAVWDLHSNKHKFFNGSHKAPITGIAFSPINSDLVVSTALDRQFCFYEIGSGKCIQSIFVENSMTAVDFSLDGQFVVMGTQKGKINIYDLKNMHKPLHTFDGHNGYIQELLFRNQSEDHDTSFTVSTDIVQEITCEVQKIDILEKCVTPSHEVMPSPILNSATAEDSFLVALGLDNSNPPPPTRHSNKYSTPVIPSKLLQEMRDKTRSPLTSTPEVPAEKTPVPEPMSPQAEVPIPDIEVMKNLIADDRKAVIDEVKKEMKYYSTHHLAETRQMFLNQLMFLVKEFIKVDDNLEGFRNDFFGLPQNYVALMEENIILKQRITELEMKLAGLQRDRL